MKLRKIRTSLATLLAGLVATGCAFAESRVWTSASDPTKTFKGELVAATTDKVTVAKDGGAESTFPLSVLSKADQEFVAANRAKLAARPVNKVHKDLSANLARGSVSRSADYYILYFAASY